MCLSGQRYLKETNNIMLIQINAAKCIGIDAVPVLVETKIDRGIGIRLVGLADVTVKESLLRTTTALQAMGFTIPGKQIIINLAPADLHKSGSGYDLPIALGILAASGQCPLPEIGKYLVMGELGLDGSVRDIPAGLPYAELAVKSGLEGIILPIGAALEATEMKEIKVFGVETLTDVLRILGGNGDVSDLLVWNTRTFRKIIRERQRRTHCGKDADSEGSGSSEIIDFADIIGQEGAKRGVEIAAAGGHNVILIGAPGSGKSSLAKAMAGILPPMTREEALVTSKIFSIAGKGNLRLGLMHQRPFRAPHYSASLAAIIGGGGGDGIIPGEVSLAQNGILFADEVGQMPRAVIESLRGPIEDRKVVISRLRGKVEYPSSFMLVAASNPCPCGYWGEGDRCTCTAGQRMAYLSKLSGPILDRIDIQCWLKTVRSDALVSARKSETSAEVAERVLKARIIQKQRFAAENEAAGANGRHILTNAEMTNRQIEKYCPLSPECKETMVRLMDRTGISMRAYFRIIRVARTIADLEAADEISARHLMEAAGYRFLDKLDRI